MLLSGEPVNLNDVGVRAHFADLHPNSAPTPNLYYLVQPAHRELKSRDLREIQQHSRARN